MNLVLNPLCGEALFFGVETADDGENESDYTCEKNDIVVKASSDDVVKEEDEGGDNESGNRD